MPVTPSSKIFIPRSYCCKSFDIYTAATLLTIKDAWNKISDRLGQDIESLKNRVDDTVDRRNDIVHRADRGRKRPDAETAQEITYSWSNHSVMTIKSVCIALDELVNERIQDLKAEIATSEVAVA